MEAVAALLRRFLQLDELQQRRQQEEEAEYGEEEEGEEDYSENSSDSDNKAEELWSLGRLQSPCNFGWINYGVLLAGITVQCGFGYILCC